jgi:predicted tellurium resistance membrane protein TerC
MEEPNDKRVQKVVIFSILMAGALASVIVLYKIALPFMENHNNLDIAAIATIIFIGLAYVMAVKGGIPPSPPKTTDK